jgi:cathepsin X
VPLLNHEVAIVGWGVGTDGDEAGIEYWHVRNSWGTWWGEAGFFRIQMYTDNLGIETDCDWGVPITPNISLASYTATAPSKEGKTYTTSSRVTKGTFHDYSRPAIVKGNVHVPALAPLSEKALPASLDYRNYNNTGLDFTTIDWNQHIPQYCGSCWAMATASAMSDRIRLLRNRAYPDVQISPQVLVNCAAPQPDGCQGGDPTQASEWIYQNGVTENACTNYYAKAEACTSEWICRDCQPGGGACTAVANPPLFRITGYGRVNGTQNMMQEIYQRGPIACTIAVTEEFEAYTGGVFKDTTGAMGLDHEIEVIGWGTDNGADYWVGRNSWGTYWGEHGWFRLIRGVDNLGIESQGCDFVLPDPASFPKTPFN